jgi:hypothetical protein
MLLQTTFYDLRKGCHDEKTVENHVGAYLTLPRPFGRASPLGRPARPAPRAVPLPALARPAPRASPGVARVCPAFGVEKDDVALDERGGFSTKEVSVVLSQRTA